MAVANGCGRGRHYSHRRGICVWNAPRADAPVYRDYRRYRYGYPVYYPPRNDLDYDYGYSVYGNRYPVYGYGAYGYPAYGYPPVPDAFIINIGDLMALAAGIIWSFGLLTIFRRKDIRTREQIAAQAGGAVLVALLLLPVCGMDGQSLASVQILDAVPWLLAMAFLLTAPMWGLSLWASRHIPPARASIIFMMEVCIGVGSAAALSGYQLHWNEYVGMALVLAATGFELLKKET